MKTRIANVLDGAARTLLVAGTFGMSVTAMAQTTQPLLEKPLPVSHGMDDPRPVPQTANSARLVEMKVELAWLADPVTSCCRLQARMMGGTLAVHGQVPGEAELAHALQLAREESGMRVLSKAQLNPRLRAPGSSKPQDVLHREAFDALRQGFPEQAPSIAVSTLADGQIVLKGTIPTYEDKLAISRHLRQATSCSCVVNQLRVLTEPREHATTGTSQAASATLLTPERIKPASIQTVAHVPPPSPYALNPTAGTSKVKDESAALATASPPAVSATGSGESSPQRPAAQPASAGPQPAPEVPPATAAKPPAKPLVYRTKWRRLDPSEMAMPKKPEPASNKTPETPALASAASMSGVAAPRSPTIMTAAAHSSAAFGLTERSQGAPLSQSTSSLPMPRAAEGSGKGEPYVTEGIVVMESAFKPAAHSVPVTGQKPSAVVRTGPYVANGVVLFSEASDEALVKSNPALAALQMHLQQRIAAACGKSSKDVEVRAATETEVAVRLKANSTLEGEELSNRIFQLPELGPCQVSLDVLVMK